MNEILFEVLRAALILLIILVMRYAVPFIRQKAENTKYEWVIRWVELAVRSAEQTVLGDKTGPEKKAIVTEFIRQQLLQKKISISDAQLETLIESAVYIMKNEEKRI